MAKRSKPGAAVPADAEAPSSEVAPAGTPARTPPRRPRAARSAAAAPLVAPAEPVPSAQPDPTPSTVPATPGVVGASAGGPARPSRVGQASVAVLALVAVLAIAFLGGSTLLGAASPSASPQPGSPIPGSQVTSAQASLSPTVVPSQPAASLAPSAVPTPQLVADPLTGLLVTPAQAMQHPIAVMIDDHVLARPQSGFNDASIVWQAPAEGGIPRYMMIFQQQIPASVGPVRSSREYFIEWAAEWHALYVHAGGSPQALATLAAEGHGQWVWNGEYFHWDGVYLWRVNTPTRFAPHNVFTDGQHLRAFARRLGATDTTLTPVWTFAPDAPLQDRPMGTRLTVSYPYETISYHYDPVSNTYRRYVTPPTGGAARLQVDGADKKPVAPKNVVILRMAFGPLNDGHPNKHRLEASDVGHGVAYISTSGITIKGTWRKASKTAPTLLFGPDGQPVTLTAGQTFVEVMSLTDTISIKAGTLRNGPIAA